MFAWCRESKRKNHTGITHIWILLTDIKAKYSLITLYDWVLDVIWWTFQSDQHFSCDAHFSLDSESKKGKLWKACWCTYTLMKMKILQQTYHHRHSGVRSSNSSRAKKKIMRVGGLQLDSDVLNSGAIAHRKFVTTTWRTFLYVFEKFHFFFQAMSQKFIVPLDICIILLNALRNLRRFLGGYQMILNFSEFSRNLLKPKIVSTRIF